MDEIPPQFSISELPALPTPSSTTMNAIASTSSSSSPESLNSNSNLIDTAMTSPSTPISTSSTYHAFEVKEIWKDLGNRKISESFCCGTITLEFIKVGSLGSNSVTDVDDMEIEEEDQEENWHNLSEGQFYIGKDDSGSNTSEVLSAMYLAHSQSIRVDYQPIPKDSRIIFKINLFPSLKLSGKKKTGKALFQAMEIILSEVRREDGDLLRERSSETLLELFNNIPSPLLEPISSNPRTQNLIDSILDGTRFPKLFHYQKLSLIKMILIEQDPMERVADVWEEYVHSSGDTFYINILNNQVERNPPSYLNSRSGILAEAPGVGKTHITISLVLSTLGQLPIVQSKILTDESLNFPCNDSLRSSLRVRVTELLGIPTTVEENRYVEALLQQDLQDEAEVQIRNRLEFPRLQAIMVDYIRTRSLSLQGTERELAVIEKQKFQSRERFYFNQVSGNKKTRGGYSSSYEKVLLAPTTLIFVPAIILNQWAKEVERWTGDLKLESFCLIVRNEVDWVGEDFTKHAMIVIADSAVTSRVAPIFLEKLRLIHFKRVVIDEGHSLSNDNKLTDFVSSLRVDHRWIVDATPTVNLAESRENINANQGNKTDLAKLGRLFEFLRCPAAVDSNWSRNIVNPFLSGVNGNLLGNLMDSLIVKTKSEDIVTRGYSLPPLIVDVVKLELEQLESISYNLLLSLFVINSICSERKDDDYFFHPANNGYLTQLVTNLLASTFFYSPDSIDQDSIILRGMLTNATGTLYKFSETTGERTYSTKALNWSEKDRKDLESAIGICELAISSGIAKKWFSYRNQFSVGVIIEGELESELMEAFGAQDLSSNSTSPSRSYLIPINQLRSLYHLIDFVRRYDSFEGSLIKFSDEEEMVQEIITIKLRLNRALVATKAEQLAEWNRNQLVKKGKGKLITSPTKKGGEKTELNSLMSAGDVGAKPKRLSTLRKLPEGNLSKIKVQYNTTSTKLNHILHSILSHPTEKFLIFSDVLTDLAVTALTEAFETFRIQYKLFVTTSALTKDPDLFSNFNNGDISQCQVLVVKAKLAGRGIHLTSATRVIFLQPIWKSDLEQQAVKRAHRLGQSSVVHAEILVIENGWDDTILSRRSEMKTQDLVQVPEGDEKLAEYLQTAKFVTISDEKEKSKVEPILFLNPFNSNSIEIPPKKKIKRELDENYGGSSPIRKKRKIVKPVVVKKKKKYTKVGNDSDDYSEMDSDSSEKEG